MVGLGRQFTARSHRFKVGKEGHDAVCHECPYTAQLFLQLVHWGSRGVADLPEGRFGIHPDPLPLNGPLETPVFGREDSILVKGLVVTGRWLVLRQQPGFEQLHDVGGPVVVERQVKQRRQEGHQGVVVHAPLVVIKDRDLVGREGRRQQGLVLIQVPAQHQKVPVAVTLGRYQLVNHRCHPFQLRPPVDCRDELQVGGVDCFISGR